MYWERTWNVRYNGTASLSAAQIEFQSAGVTPQSLSLPWTSFTQDAYPGGATFTGTTAEGKQAWITVTDADGLVGAGYKGSEAGDQLHCGVSRNGVDLVSAITQTNLVCGTYQGDANAYPGGDWVLDARGYPWTSLSSEGRMTVPVWEVSNGADGRTVSVNVYNGGENTGSIYHLRDGQLIGYESPRSRSGGPPQVCWLPAG